ncbi:MAG: DUF1501 domain-containing protein [Akkermansiaceae bacterium]
MKTRRDFMRSAVLGASASWTLPGFIDKTFAELGDQASDQAVQFANGKDDTILVVLQMAGGNDGLNTLVPYEDDLYYKARPTLGKKKNNLIQLEDGLGLNNSMPFLGSMFKEGSLGVVQGVGYPNPNRSHFVSTSVWETADTNGRANTGWLGRYFDNACEGTDPTFGISFNKSTPESFGAMRNPGASLSSPELYRWIHGGGQRAQAEEFFGELNQPIANDNEPISGGSIEMAGGGKVGAIVGESNLKFLERVALDAQVSSKKILEVAAKHKTKVKYDGTPIARNLNLVSRMIAGGMATRVYYVSHGGFDTHTGQLNTHDRLLGQLDSALKSFFTDLKQQGNDKRVMLMTFSEFGRRVAQNASAGTDHGQASCMFVAGGGVKGGMYGEYPSLSELSQGDLVHTVDFRSVYADMLNGWLKAPGTQRILGGKFDGIGLV